jgi:H+-transporting ATPase
MKAVAEQKVPESKPDAKDDLKSLPLTEVEKKLRSSPDGLRQADAQKRLAQFGPNEIEEKKTNPFLRCLSYFWGPIPWMIELAVILSGVVGHWPDFSIILTYGWATLCRRTRVRWRATRWRWTGRR